MPTEKILLPPCSCFDKIIRFRFCQIGNHRHPLPFFRINERQPFAFAAAVPLIFRSFTASGRMSLPSTRSFMT